MIALINYLNFALIIIITGLYFYRNIYILIGLLSKRKKKQYVSPKKLHSYAIIIAARNEQAVIGELIKSIKNQKYPKELYDIFVVADNCTDNTAQTARDEGAIVFERHDQTYTGKGYALNHIFAKINISKYEGYFVFDADNLLDENYILEMNRLFDKGYRVLTSYRNSKNYYQSWISAGYALWFLHEAEFINNPRMILGKSCEISGTGFLIHRDIIQKNGGWKYYLFTEDIEFTVSEVIQGETIGYCGSAVFYDEQPVTFKQSWNQRLRWAKGYYQVLGKYGTNLFICSLQRKKQSFSCYDMMMTILPTMLVLVMSIAINSLSFIAGLLNGAWDPQILSAAFLTGSASFVNYYGIIFAIGVITTITEWKRIYCSSAKKILYLFTFPIFTLTYIPIAIVALFKEVKWKPIVHTCVKSLQDVREQNG